MEIIITFLVTVAAGVVCHLISKWLDRHDKDSRQPGGCFATIKRKEESLDCTPLQSGDSFFRPNGLIITFCLMALQHMQILITRYISFSQSKNFILILYQSRMTALQNSLASVRSLSLSSENKSHQYIGIIYDKITLKRYKNYFFYCIIIWSITK